MSLRNFTSVMKIKVNSFYAFTAIVTQKTSYWGCTGDSNSQMHKKIAKCQLEEVPGGGQVLVRGQKFNPCGRFFPNFVGGKNLTPFFSLE